MTGKTKTTLILGAMLLSATFVAPVASASGDHASYRDQFKEVSFTGSDGSLTWASPWVEVGESDGPTAGVVRVVDDSHCAAGRCLSARGGLLPLDKVVGATRHADTSIFNDAKLSYHLRSRSFGLLDGTVEVQVTTNRGATWTTVDGWTLVKLSDPAKTKVVSIDEYLSDGFGVRFVITGLVGGELFVDDVEIKGTLTPSTTSTTNPQPTTTTPTATTSKPVTTSTSPPSQASGGDEATSPPRNGSGAATTSTTTPTPTTTSVRVTATTEVSTVVAPDDVVPPPDSGGLRHAQHGIQAGYDPGMFGDADMIRPEVLELTVDYGVAVEVVSSSWVPLIGLVLVITAALITGFDRHTRRHRG